MKKLITAAMTLALAAGLASAQVTSDNIVGYVTITNAPGDIYSSYGNCFITVGDLNTEAKLGDITADGMDPLADTIQFLDPNDANVSLYATYIDAATAAAWSLPPEAVGWYNLDLDTSLETTVVPAGTGFLCNIPSGNTVVFTFAGEVVQATIDLDVTGQIYPMVANTVPADLTLGDITAEGMDPLADTIQFLDPSDANVAMYATYIDAATAAAWSLPPEAVGWYNLDLDTSLDATALPAATAFLCNLPSGNTITIGFPNPVAP